MSSPYDLKRAHGAYPGRFLNLASGDGILIVDVQAAAEVIARSEGCDVSEAEVRAMATTTDSVKRPSSARDFYTRLRACPEWDRCPHGYVTAMSLSAAEPQRIGSFLVRAPWQASVPKTRDIVIRPGLSFGLGTHATTRLPLLQLPDVLQRGARCADVGCGSGVLAIAMARLGADEVVAVDVDATAVLEAADNVGRNEVERIVSTVSTGSADALPGLFDVITANMGGAPNVIRIGPNVAKHLKPGGTFLASGIYGDTDDAAAAVADGVSAALAKVGLLEERRDTEHHCVGIIYRRIT